MYSDQPGAGGETAARAATGLWVLPTYGRPAQCVALLAQIAATSSARGVVLVTAEDAAALADAALPDGWHLIHRHPDDHGLIAALNRFLAHFPDLPWYGLIADDNWPVSPDWDAPLVETALAHGIASSDDGWQAPRRMHGAVVWRGDVLRAAGFWGPPCLSHCYFDDFWESVGRRFRLWQCRMDVLVEHRHYRNQRAAPDATYDRADAVLLTDRSAYDVWLRTVHFATVIERLEAIAPPPPADQAARLARARTRSVFIATPMARHPVRQYAASMDRTTSHLLKLGIRGYVQSVVGISNLAAARNELVADFLASDYTDLLWIDDDMGWEPNDVIRLLASDKPVIGGVGAKKRAAADTDLAKWCMRLNPNLPLVQDEMGAIEVEAVGTGFLKIERGVFEALAAAHPEWKRRGHASMPPKVREKYYGFYLFEDTFEEWGEDFRFCREWAALGGKTYIDPAIKLVHVGECEYSGNLSALFEAAP